MQSGEDAEDGGEVFLADVQHQADALLRFHSALQHKGEVVDLAALLAIGVRALVGDQLCVGFEDGFENAETVRAEGTSGLCDFYDRVCEHGSFHFGGSPGKFDADIDAPLTEIIAGDVDEFRGDDAIGEIFGALEGGIFGGGEDPSDFAAAALGVDQIADGGNFQTAFDDPIETGEAGVDRTVLNVAGHFLCADQETVNLGIGGSGKIGAAVGVGGQSGACEELQSCFLQTAFGDADAEFHRVSLAAAG